MSIYLAGLQLGNITNSPVSITLEDLADVSVSSPVSGQYLRYNSSISEWQNVAINSDVYNFLSTNLTSSNGIILTDVSGPQQVNISLSVFATGDATGYITGNYLPLTLATVNTAPVSNSFQKITTNGKGLVTASSNVNSYDIINSLGYTPINKAGDSMYGYLLLNANPTTPLGAATKQYVDSAAVGLSVHAAARVGTVANLTATYNNGTSGVGATLTNSGTQAAIIIDGVALSLNDRVVVLYQTSQPQNGIYTVTTVGSGSTNWVLTRATDADGSTPGLFGDGSYIFINQGTVNANTGWVETNKGSGAGGAFIFGTDNIVWTQFSAANSYQAGTGLSLTGNIFANTGVLSNVAGSGISVSGATGDVTISNIGVLSNIAGSNITVSSSTGNVTISLASTPTIVGTNFSGIPNSALLSSAITIGSTNISLGGTSTTLAGLTSVTSTSFIGNASTSTTSTNISGGLQYQIPFQSAASTTTFNSGLAFNSSNSTLTVGTGTLSLAAGLTTSGANNITLTTTGITSVTLPTSGTLLSTTSSPSSFPILNQNTTGNAATSTTTSNISLTTTSANSTFYIPFANASSGSSVPLTTDTLLTFNPNSNTLSAPTFNGALSSTSTATTQPFTDNSTKISTTAFSLTLLNASMATVPLSGITGGIYNFATIGTGLTFVFHTNSGTIDNIMSISAGGSGYAVGDLINVVGASSGNQDAIVQVATVGAGGSVTSLTILYGGTGYTGTASAASGTPYDITLSHTYTLTGTLTSNATFILPAGTRLFNSNQWIINNNTTGAFTVTWKLSNGSGGSIGTGVIIPQGTNNNSSQYINTDGVSDVWFAAPSAKYTGSVTSVSVTSANGFSGSVATSTTTPAITLSTTITGLLKGNGTAISAATAGTDYAPATSGTSILYGNGAGGFSNVTVGSGLTFSGGTLSATGGTFTLSSGSAVSGSSSSAITFDINGTNTNTTMVQVASDAVIPSTASVEVDYYKTVSSTAAASFTVPKVVHYLATQGTLGAGSVITSQYGFYASSTISSATNNYGFYSNISSASTNWNIYAPGAAHNYLAGNLLINTTTDNGTDNLQVSGTILATGVLKTNGSTLTLAGNLTTSGAFATTLTSTATTNVTLPTSGTLATTANINTALPSITTSQLYGGTGGVGVAQAVSVGTGLSISSGTLSNSGVTSAVAGTDISVSSSTGAVTINDTSTLATVTSRGATTSTALTLNGLITLGNAENYAPDITLPSAATVNIGAASSNNIIISGTNTITAFDTIAAGVIRFVKFSGSLTLTYNSVSLILPGTTNIITAANDCAIFKSLGSGNWICIDYTKATGNPIVAPNLTGPITSTGTATAIASQTGTGTTFVMQNTPTLITPVIGVATGTSLVVTGTIQTGGTSPVTASAYSIGSSLSLTGTTEIGYNGTWTSATAGTALLSSFYSSITVPASTAVTNINHFEASGISLGSGASNATQVGFYAGTLTSATNNYGFQSAVASGTNNYGFYNSGNAANNLGTGNTTVGTLNGLTITTSTGTLTITNAKTLSITNTLTLSGTDSTTMTFPSSSATIAATNVSQTWTATPSFTGSTSAQSLRVTNATEIADIIGSAPSATQNFYISSGAIQYYTSNAANNVTVNFAWSSGTSLNTALAIGDTVTVSFWVTNGSTPYYISAYQIDGSSITPKWQGGTAPSAGDANATDVYTFTIMKTASATYTVLGALTQYK